MQAPYIASSIVQNLLRIAAQRSIDTQTLFPVLHQMDTQSPAHVPFAQYASLYAYVLEQSQDPDLGLHIGEQYNLAALGLVGQLIQVSGSIRESIQHSSQYFNLISNVLQIELQQTAELCRLVFVLDRSVQDAYPAVCQQLLYASMVFAWRELDILLDRNYDPFSVHFTASAERQTEAKRIFDCPLYFNATENAISFDASILAQKIIYSDYQLMLTLEQVACQRLTDLLPESRLWQDKIKQMIYAMLGPQIPSIDTLAHNLAMSPRSIQRKLKAEGSSYAQLTLAIKKDLALTYLNKDLSIKEISFLMGYAETSSFVHAFKKWFGQSPLRYRNLA